MKILVLMGGDSPERDVSFASGAAIMTALETLGHQVIAIDPAEGFHKLSGKNAGLLKNVKTAPPDPEKLPALQASQMLETIESFDFREVDLIFLALHGGKGEDGTLQALLDLTGKPYTGSGMLASALAMNKALAKRLFEREQIPTPFWSLFESARDFSIIERQIAEKFSLPVVIKPNNQGSTVGLTVVRTPDAVLPALKEAARFSTQILVEQFIAGREITVGILGNRALPVVEIIPQHEVYDYECKYTKGRSQYICPAELTPAATKEVQRLGLRAFQALGCSGYARVDFRLGSEGQFYCLEVNTLPGMTSLSLVPMAAQTAGIAFPHLLEEIIAQALQRKVKVSEIATV